jgi:tyrosine decarboxylase/aspartate 1-decarboxylase
MQRGIISMMGSLWGSENSPGFITAGGTECNILAIYVARNLAKGKHGSVVLPSTAHPSFWKACDWFGLEPVSVPVNEDFTANAEKMRNAVKKDTIALVATCGTYPWATIDPIEDISKIAAESSLYFHVDAAIGGLMCPWLEEAGYEIPEFGFNLEGISSISSDPHKQGFSVYPAGAILFRDEELLRHASFKAIEAGFTYSTFGLLGTRPGSTVAITWALFNYLGREGYVRLSKKCMELTLRLIDGMEKIPGLYSITKPKINVANAMSSTLQADLLVQSLRRKGWRFDAVSAEPIRREKGIAVAPLPYNERVLPTFLDDLSEAASEAKPSATVAEVRLRQQ